MSKPRTTRITALLSLCQGMHRLLIEARPGADIPDLITMIDYKLVIKSLARPIESAGRCELYKA